MRFEECAARALGVGPGVCETVKDGLGMPGRRGADFCIGGMGRLSPGIAAGGRIAPGHLPHDLLDTPETTAAKDHRMPSRTPVAQPAC